MPASLEIASVTSDRVGLRRILRAGGVFVAALLAVALLLALYVYAPPPLSNTRFGLGTAERRVALTFDDGPNAAATAAILNKLNQYGVKATFFLILERAQAHPALVRRMVAEGHALGFHFIEGAYPATTPLQRSLAAIAAFDRLAASRGYDAPIPFRAPSLRLGLPLAAALKRQGRLHVAGGVLGWDWEDDRQDGAAIAERVLSLTGPGAIIVLHDGGHARDGANRRGVVAALDTIIPMLRGRGYDFVTLEGLARKEAETSVTKASR